MEKKINLVEILQQCPSGTKLYSPIFGDVYLDKIRPHLAIVVTTDKEQGKIKEEFLYDGRYGMNGECMLFPSKDQRDWSKFQIPVEFKDGDILISVHGNPFIFKETHNDKICGCYCGIAQNGVLGIESPHWTSNYNLQLATVEEKQKLFDTIRENGYKWNNETKTLEKLIVPKFKVGDRIKYRHGEIIYRIVKITEDTYVLDKLQSIPISLEYMYNLVPNKFDISTLKTFDKVLVWDGYTEKWNIDFFGRFDDNSKLFKTMTGSYSQCIPYEDNEHLFDTDDDCIEYYKTWEE